MNITYGELRTKEVVNIVDGRKLGRVCDIVISCDNCQVQGIVVPNERRFFHSREDIFVPWKNIKQIGDDCILVSLHPQNFECPTHKPRPKTFCDYIIDDKSSD